MSNFKRENRYLVVKRKDLNGVCDEVFEPLREAIDALGVEFKRIGIKRREFVVVEHDWPEFEIVWGMIQDRVEGRPNELERLRAQLAQANEAMQEFVDKVDHGEARSVRTYARFKELLQSGRLVL